MHLFKEWFLSTKSEKKHFSNTKPFKSYSNAFLEITAAAFLEAAAFSKEVAAAVSIEVAAVQHY